MRKWFNWRSTFVSTAVAAAGVVLFAIGAQGVSGAGELAAPVGSDPETGQQYNPTHWAVVAGDPFTDTIINATDAVTGGGTCGTDQVVVTIQSSSFGNQPLCGDFDSTTKTITFSWTATSPNGVCGTTIVSYNTTGNLANNKLLNGIGHSAAGLAIVDSSGNVIQDCVAEKSALPLTVFKNAIGTDTRTYKWTIGKAVDQHEIDGASTTGAFNYTVSVQHDSGTVSDVKVKGTITVTNPNLDSVNINAIDDRLSDGTICTVANGGAQSFLSGGHQFNYECDLSGLPSTPLTNTVTISWPDQHIADGELIAGEAPFTTPNPITFTETAVDDCVNVTDTLGGNLGKVCVGGDNPTTFTYSHTVHGTAGTCVTQDNTATYTTNTTGTTHSASQSVKLCTGADLQVSKTAATSFTRKFVWGISKAVDHTLIQQSGTSATFNYTVNVTHDAGTDSAWLVSGTITVKNPNDWETITANVSDLIDNNGVCIVGAGSGVPIAAGASEDFAYTCSYESAPNPTSGTNTGTATWDSAAAFTPHGSASGTAPYAFTDPTTIVDGSVSVVDSLVGVIGTVSYTDPSPTALTYAYIVTTPSGTCKSVDNTATFTTSDTHITGSDSKTVTLCVAADLQVSKTADTSFTRTFTWGITKSVDNTVIRQSGTTATFNYIVSVTHDSGIDSDWQVAGMITVSNPNTWEDITTNVADAIDNGGSCSVIGGSNLTVPRTQSVTLPYTCTYASAPTKSSGLNTATAAWDSATAFTPDASASGSAGYTFGAPTKIVDGSVTVTDTLEGALGTVSYADPSPTTLKYSTTVTGTPGTCVTQNNTATFVTSDSSTNGSGSQGVQLCVGADPQVSKTATTSFTRTYTWTIVKAVDKTTLEAGGTAHYTVTASEIGYADSNFQVMGTITVANPNDWESVTVTGITDSIDHGGSCAVTGGTNVTIAPKSSASVSYSCTFGSNPLLGTNTASAVWNATTFFTPHATATGTAAYAFGAPTTRVNQTIHVVDSLHGALGTATAVDSPPFTVQPFNYTIRFNPPSSGCVTINNTATIVETGANSSASVKVCNTGALTMGFWQNKNGQAIIAGGTSTGGVCNSGTWLRQFASFQDLSSTATCSQVAAYFTSTFAAANAGGSTMNPMLKAQMLATALDVYFSDPALGGNKIGAPAPIGGVVVDLTKIYGTENVSAAFGGATSKTVMQLLQYAGGQSNVGGSSWYSQNKSLQGLAKDTFDSINNQTIVSP
ncbi:MAG TPA: hypothetical protein VFR33_05890 [Candidatus Dormibacteraeota bacterium]|nr:hypothetical protein [Candidatus Dormibacteraeota bacterium]